MQKFNKTLTLNRATLAEKPILARMVQLYLHDFSEYADIGTPYGDIDNSGVFLYPKFDSYWEDETHEPLLIRLDANIVGFVFINQWSASGLQIDKSVAEFFILRKYRSAGIGKMAALQIIKNYQGVWEIPIAEYNQQAKVFWSSVIKSLPEYEFQNIKGDDQRWFGSIWRGYSRSH